MHSHDLILTGLQAPRFKAKKDVNSNKKRRKVNELDIILDVEEQEFNMMFFEVTDDESDSDDSLFEP